MNNDGQGATPREYLDRLRLQNDIFNDDVRLEGVIPSVTGTKIVTSQPYIVGEGATAAQVDAYMHSKGFDRLDEGAYYHPQAQILVHDLFPRNAVATPEGKVRAIDAAIMRATPEMAEYIRLAAQRARTGDDK